MRVVDESLTPVFNIPGKNGIVKMGYNQSLKVSPPCEGIGNIRIDIGANGHAQITAPQNIVEIINDLPAELLGWSVKQVLIMNTRAVSATDLRTDLIDLAALFSNKLNEYLEAHLGCQDEFRFKQISKTIDIFVEALEDMALYETKT